MTQEVSPNLKHEVERELKIIRKIIKHLPQNPENLPPDGRVKLYIQSAHALKDKKTDDGVLGIASTLHAAVIAAQHVDNNNITDITRHIARAFQTLRKSQDPTKWEQALHRLHKEILSHTADSITEVSMFKKQSDTPTEHDDNKIYDPKQN